MPSPVEIAPQNPGKSHKVVSGETHERVLDIVFQLDEADRNYDFILRFEPSFAPESQIVIKSEGGKTSVVEYTSLSGNIYRKLNSVMANGGKENVVEMAKLIEVRKRVVEVQAAQAALWRTSFADSIGATVKVLEERREEAARGIGTITIDGTFYSLWRDQDGSRISTGVWDHEVSNREVTGELKLVQWMNTLRRDVATLTSKKDSVNQTATTKRPK